MTKKSWNTCEHSNMSWEKVCLSRWDWKVPIKISDAINPLLAHVLNYAFLYSAVLIAGAFGGNAFLKISQDFKENTCITVYCLIKSQACLYTLITSENLSFLRGIVCGYSETCILIKKQTRAQVFSCECCEIFNNTHFVEHLRTGAF